MAFIIFTNSNIASVHFEQAALSAARFADEVGKFALPDVQADVVEHDAPVLLTDVRVVEFDNHDGSVDLVSVDLGMG